MKEIVKYYKTFLLSVQNSMEYRVSFFLSIFSCIFPIIIQYFLWSSIYNNSSKTVIAGYNYSQMILYVVLASLVSKLMATGFEYEVSSDIKVGGLNKFIVQPIGYFLYRVCCFIGQKLIQMGILLIIIFGILITVRVSMGFSLELSRIVLFIAAMFLGLILNFLIYFSLSTIAFWMTEVWGIYLTFGLISNIVSGGIFPIDIFGQKLQAVFNFLPFQYVIFYPISIINGRLSLDSLPVGFLYQLLWIVVFMLLANLLWRNGLKKYVAVGG